MQDPSRTMDLLYLIGPDSGHENRELRWSLRSVEKYARGLGRVVVAGYPPDWLSEEVARVPARDEPDESKFVSIWRKLFAALDAGAVSGEFLVSADDHFYSAPADLAATPFFTRGELRRFEDTEARDGGRAYRRHLAATRRVLARAGYGTRDCASHCNFRVRAEDAPDVRRLWETAEPNERIRAFDLCSCFYNVRAKKEEIEFTFRRDRKIVAFDAEAVASGQFSIGNRAFDDPRLLSYMDAEFGRKSRFEK